jgi:hypothetical protein
MEPAMAELDFSPAPLSPLDTGRSIGPKPPPKAQARLMHLAHPWTHGSAWPGNVHLSGDRTHKL